MDHAAPCCGAPTGRSSLRLQVFFFWGGGLMQVKKIKDKKLDLGLSKSSFDTSKFTLIMQFKWCFARRP